jgi:uncharacterized protein YhaN
VTDVRFESVGVDAFGGLRDLETGPLPGFVVVEGANEAGKTSFFELLIALLYGFYPASRDRNPWAPWDGTTASGRAIVRLGGGACLEVQRRLLSAPTGTVVRGAREDALRNETLACAAHVPLGIYRQVFALGLSELAALDAEGWSAVEDRLMGALGARDVRSAREVAGELEAEAGAVWRPHRRGSQRVRALDERLRQLAHRRAEVLSEERRVRDVHRELAELGARLTDARAAREQCRDRLARARTLEPIGKALARLAGFRERAGDADLLDGLPSDPPARLDELRRRLVHARGEVEALAAARTAPAEALAAFTDLHRARLEHDADVRVLAGRVATTDPDRVRLGQVQQEMRDLERRLEAALRPWAPEVRVDEARLLALRPSVVAGAVNVLLAAREHAERLDPRQGGAPAGATLPPALLAVGLATGVVMLVVGLALSVLPLVVAGTALVAGGAVALVLARRGGRTRARGSAARLAEAREHVQRAAAELDDAMDGLVVAPSDTAGLAALPSALERARELVRDLEDRRRTRSELEAHLDEVARSTVSLAGSLALPEADPDQAPAATLHRLQEALREADERARAARHAKRELAALAERASRARDALTGHDADLRALVDRLAALGGGDADEGAREAASRMHARRRADELAEELARDYTPEQIESVRTMRASPGRQHGAAPADDDATALAGRERQLTDEIEALAQRALRLEGEVERLAGRQTLDALDGEGVTLTEERERLVRERDRLWILARIVREADRWVREEHQPDILRRAGALLGTLTGGRYDRVVLSSDGRGFRVRGPAVPDSVAVGPPLSTGTREQVYLALRLALLDTLDGGGERLPLMLDEVLVNWDRERRDRGLDALAELASHRQVFLLTCHRPLAEAARDRGARLLRLEGP